MELQMFILAALMVIATLFLAFRGRGDGVGWWIGLAHGVLALVALVAVRAAHDTGFAVFAVLLLIYAGAMCAAEVAHLARKPRT